MEIWDVVTVIFYLFTTNEVALCHVINADSLVTMDTQLEGFHFWSSRVSGLDSCAKACMRTKMCVSFNFQLDAKLCYLNFDNVSNHQDATITRNRALYSDIAVWPPELDLDCFERNCAMDEACVPGVVAKSLNLPLATCSCYQACSYGCLKIMNLKCPVPENRVALSRSVGSEAVCAKGSVGDSSVCLINQTWSKEIETPCKALYEHSCTTEAECTAIDGTCENNICTCPSNMVYNNKTLTCESSCTMVFDNSCYTVVQVPKNWTDAKDHCEATGSLLLSLETEAELSNIQSKMLTMSFPGTLKYWWTSGHDRDKDGTFVWDMVGTVVGITWNPGYPFPTQTYERCATLYSSVGYNLVDRKCYNLYPFICEKQI